MGKTKERLIQIQEEMLMGWHEDVELEMATPIKLPTTSSNTLSEPVQSVLYLWTSEAELLHKRAQRTPLFKQKLY